MSIGTLIKGNIVFVRIAVNMLCLGQRKGDVSSVIRAFKNIFLCLLCYL